MPFTVVRCPIEQDSLPRGELEPLLCELQIDLRATIHPSAGQRRETHMTYHKDCIVEVCPAAQISPRREAEHH